MIFGQVHWGKFPRKRRVSHDINIADSLYSMGSALFVLDFTRERLIIVCEGRGISCLHGNSQSNIKKMDEWACSNMQKPVSNESNQMITR